MIGKKAQPINLYPDDFIKGIWVDWSDNYLSRAPDSSFQELGFQSLIGSQDSSDRSRASEAYTMGLLRNRIVRSRSGGDNIPAGWLSICKGGMAHSYLGYLAWVIGKASRDISVPEAFVERHLDAINFLISLTFGIKIDGQIYSTILIYQHAVNSFRNAIGPKVFDQHKEQMLMWIGSAVFFSLDEPTLSGQVVSSYRQGLKIVDLKVSNGDSQFAINPSILISHLQGKSAIGVEFNKLENPRAPRYWVNMTRGIYARSRRAGHEFLDELLVEDIASFQSSNVSLLASAMEAASNGEYDSIQLFHTLFESHPTLSKLWTPIMDSLKSGALEAIDFLSNAPKIPDAHINFHLHGINAFEDLGDGQYIVSLDKDGIPFAPDIGSRIHFADIECELLSISQVGEQFKLQLALVSAE